MALHKISDFPGELPLPTEIKHSVTAGQGHYWKEWMDICAGGTEQRFYGSSFQLKKSDPLNIVHRFSYHYSWLGQTVYQGEMPRSRRKLNVVTCQCRNTELLHQVNSQGVVHKHLSICSREGGVYIFIHLMKHYGKPRLLKTLSIFFRNCYLYSILYLIQFPNLFFSKSLE